MQRSQNLRGIFATCLAGLLWVLALSSHITPATGTSWIRDGKKLLKGGEIVLEPMSALYLPGGDGGNDMGNGGGGDNHWLLKGNLTLEVREWKGVEAPTNLTHETILDLVCLSAYECCRRGHRGTIVFNRHRAPVHLWVIPRNYCGTTPLRCLLFVLPTIFVFVALTSAWIQRRYKGSWGREVLDIAHLGHGYPERNAPREEHYNTDLEDGGISMSYVMNPPSQRRFVYKGDSHGH